METHERPLLMETPMEGHMARHYTVVSFKIWTQNVHLNLDILGELQQ
jgi:hypothetical protein